MITTESANNNQTSQHMIPNATFNYEETATIIVERNEQINTLPPNYSQADNTVTGVHSNSYSPQTKTPDTNQVYERNKFFNYCFGITFLVIFCSANCLVYL